LGEVKRVLDAASPDERAIIMPIYVRKLENTVTNPLRRLEAQRESALP
jgi:hypothetical protein